MSYPIAKISFRFYQLICLILAIVSTTAPPYYLYLVVRESFYHKSGPERSLSTSVESMIPLLELESVLIDNLEDYADELQAKLNTVRSAASAMRFENNKAMKNPEKYLSNPLHSFAFIRRMNMDWVAWEFYMAKPVGTAQVIRLQEHRTDLPSSIDLTEAATSMCRLQTTYDLNPIDIAKGVLQDQQFDSRLSPLDCLSIAEELIKDEKYHFANFWLSASLQIYERGEFDDIVGLSKLKILEVYAESLLQQNSVQEALNILGIALRENPNSTNILRRQEEIELLAITRNLGYKKFQLSRPGLYEFGCRGEFSEITRLHCRYNSTTTPFLKLAPLKMEEINLDPYMVLFHDVVTDNEIVELQNMVSSKLKRARVTSDTVDMIDNTRTSHESAVRDDANNASIRLNQRVTDMTGFNMEGSEMLQVLNYGLGGHYATHCDYFRFNPTSNLELTQGNRISTVLFYFSDVEKGGATVFPKIKKAVFPRKGTALVFYNLNNRGVGDPNTLHAACPVIVGSKWVTTKWIHELNQVFTKPCFLEP